MRNKKADDLASLQDQALDTLELQLCITKTKGGFMVVYPQGSEPGAEKLAKARAIPGTHLFKKEGDALDFIRLVRSLHNVLPHSAQALRDRSMKAQGFTHKTTAWIHPAEGGDDYMIIVHSKGALSDIEVKRMLKRRRSQVLDDFKTVEL